MISVKTRDSHLVKHNIVDVKILKEIWARHTPRDPLRFRNIGFTHGGNTTHVVNTAQSGDMLH